MKWKILMCTVIATLTMASGFVEGQRAQDARSAVKMFFEEPAKRTEVMMDLRRMDRLDISRALASFVSSKDKVEQEDAIALATTLRVPYLYPHLKDALQSDELRDKAMTLVCSTQDSKAMEDLYRLYKKSDDKAVRASILAVFQKWGLPPDLVKKIWVDLRREKDDQQLRLEMFEVVKYQMGLDPGLTESKVSDQWRRYLIDFEQHSKPVESDGWNLLAWGEPTIQGTTPAGFNYRLRQDGQIKMSLMDDSYQRRSMTIHAWLFVPLDAAAEVGITVDAKAWRISTVGDQWQIHQVGDNRRVKLRRNEWVEMTLEITNRSIDGERPKRIMKWTVGGYEILPTGGTLDGELNDIYFKSNQGEFILGSCAVK